MVDALLPAIIEAANIQMHYFRSGTEVEQKSDNSPVTVADRESEQVLIAALRSCCPDIPIIAEESVAAGVIPEIGDMFFLVDPLDGTREFISGRGEFTINIGLIQNRRPIFGLIYAPVTDTFYVTLGGEKAMHGKLGGSTPAANLASLQLDQMHVKPGAENSAMTAVASRSHLNDDTRAILESLNVTDTVSSGSSLKFGLIAEGCAQVYPRLAPTMEWDTAAGHAILNAAGGAVYAVDGSEFLYAKHEQGFLNPGFIAWADPARSRAKP